MKTEGECPGKHRRAGGGGAEGKRTGLRKLREEVSRSKQQLQMLQKSQLREAEVAPTCLVTGRAADTSGTQKPGCNELGSQISKV